MQNLIRILVLCTFPLAGCAHAADQFNTCELNQNLQNEKSAELQKIEEEDQADRAGPYDSIDWNKVNPRDTARRIKVATIFADGCLKTAADYAAAAMVFQHGTVADHYYQTFIWANQAVKIGDSSQRWLTAAGLDRYLVKVGHKQLFGTQFSKDSVGKFCLQPVESSFSDVLRIEYLKRTLKDNTAHVLKGIGATQSPEETKNCEPGLKDSPKGTVPGFW